MKAYRVHEYGDAAKFIEDEVNKPSAKQGHVVVEVKASSLTPLTISSLKVIWELILPYLESFIWMWLGS